MERHTANGYDDDIVAWAREQVFLLRSGQLPLIDIDHIVAVIEQLAADSQQERALSRQHH
jgi:hypothetical protein